MRHRTLILALLPAAGALLLAACGQKGPLVMPPARPAVTAPAQAPATARPASAGSAAAPVPARSG